MDGIFQVFRGRVGIAIIGAILIGGVAAALGAGSVARPTSPTGLVQGSSTSTTSTAQATTSPESSATATAQATSMDTPTAAAPTTTPNATPQTTLPGTVVSVDPGNHRFIITRNGVQTTILVDDVTTYGGIATQLTDLQQGWQVTITIAKREDNGVLAKSVFASLGA